MAFVCYERGRIARRPRNPLHLKHGGLCHLHVVTRATDTQDGPGKRGWDALNTGFHEHEILFRAAGDTIALTPPLIISEDQVGELVEKVGKVIKSVA